MPAKARKSERDEVPPAILTGVYVFPNGDKYEGEYIIAEDGALERSGKGSQITSDGTVYEGSWSNDKMTGYGRLTHPSGSVYEGPFVQNKFDGKGKYTWPNGSVFIGSFSENKMIGYGEFTDTDLQVWKGDFHYKAAPGLKFKMVTI